MIDLVSSYQYTYRYLDTSGENGLKQREKLRNEIATRVRDLRLERQWSQAELAAELGLSQSRLSELERGGGSFTAEQLLVMSQIFNVAPSEFARAKKVDEHAELQNALARHGAAHLQERDDLVPKRELDVPRVIRDAIISGVPRLITALAPVLVLHIDRINFTKVYASLAEAGLERRLAWLLENVSWALLSEIKGSPPRAWLKRYRRAALVVEKELAAAESRQREHAVADLLDRNIRSAKTRRQVEEAASDISRRWGIVTSIGPGDFAEALGEARVDH